VDARAKFESGRKVFNRQIMLILVVIGALAWTPVLIAFAKTIF
jgi:hypothetical protein